MKQNILLISLGSALLASVLGIIAVMSPNVDSAHSVEAVLNVFVSTARLYEMAGIFGLFSIASFFVGLAYPTGETVTFITNDKGNETKTVVNG